MADNNLLYLLLINRSLFSNALSFYLLNKLFVMLFCGRCSGLVLEEEATKSNHIDSYVY